MSYVERVGFIGRGAFEKAKFPDEAIVRMQLQPGHNIWFEYLPNLDIVIHSFDAGGSAAAGNRFVVATVKLTMHPPSNSGARQWRHAALLDDNAPEAHRRHFGSEYFIDVCHNWELADAHHYIQSITDVTEIVSVAPTFYASIQEPHVVGIDVNRVRVWGTVLPPNSLDPDSWQSEEDQLRTHFLPFGEDDGQEEKRGLYEASHTFQIRLLEIPKNTTDPLIVMGGLS